MNIHGAAGVRRVWAGAGLQRATYRGGGILRGFPHSLFYDEIGIDSEAIKIEYISKLNSLGLYRPNYNYNIR